MAANEQQLINKQQNEFNALRKKIEAGVKEQEKQRAKELERSSNPFYRLDFFRGIRMLRKSLKINIESRKTDLSK
jgi:hypothetical protein